MYKIFDSNKFIQERIEYDKEKLKDSLDMLKRCSAAPIDTDGDLISHINSPDIIVEKDKNEWIVSLNEETLPKVIVLTGYWEELSRKKLSKDDKKIERINRAEIPKLSRNDKCSCGSGKKFKHCCGALA